MIRLIIISLALFFASCSTQKKEAERLALLPQWVKTTPMLNGYYVGISSVKKIGSSPQYIKKAKQEALANMAESISSKVSSKSVLHTIENKYGFSDSFSQTIKISSDEYIAGFEAEQVYEDASEYWIYYKISHSKYAKMKKIHKDKAIESALLKYQEAIRLSNDNKIVESVDFLLQGLKILKPYLNEENITTLKGESIDIANTIHSTAVETLKQFSIVCNKKSIHIKNNQYIPSDLLFTVLHKNKKISGIPVILTYSGSYLKHNNLTSKIDGSISIVSEKISSYKSKEQLLAQVDIKKIIQTSCKDIKIRSLMPQKINTEYKIPIYISKENISLDVVLKSNASIENKYIQAIFKQIAIQHKYEISKNSISDYSVRLEYNYKKGERAGHLTSYYIAGNISVLGKGSKDIWTKDISTIKAVGTSDIQAKAKAFELLKQHLKIRYFKQAIDIIKHSKI